MPEELPIIIREIHEDDNIEAITALLHRAYGGLAAMGFRYLATHQDAEMTRRRLAAGEGWVVTLDGEIVGTVTLYGPGKKLGGCDWYERADIAKIGQFGIEPAYQGKGIGSRLMDMIEQRAKEIGAVEMSIDTAEGASHLIAMYKKRGYRLVGEADWDVTNYISVVMSKVL